MHREEFIKPTWIQCRVVHINHSSYPPRLFETQPFPEKKNCNCEENKTGTEKKTGSEEKHEVSKWRILETEQSEK